jgi:hypothetical protein
MDDEPKEKVFTMHVNRLKQSRDAGGRTSPADLLLGREAPEQQRDQGGEAKEAVVPPPATVPANSDDPGGGPESFDHASADYKAFGWAGNKTLPSLIFILKDGSEYGINYGDLASACPTGSMFLPSAPGFKGNVIRLRVAGDDGVFMPIIEGLRLRKVWGLIMAHKTPWIHELPADMAVVRDDEPVIWSIGFLDKQRLAAIGGGR